MKKNNRNLRKVSHLDFDLFYEVYGDGDTSVLCFHGNGRTAEDFKFLQKDTRKIISIHLFLHDFSTFSPHRIEQDFITSKHVEKLLEKILIQEAVNNFHWVAYSQGGRFTLSALPFFAHRVKSLFLIAPDGLDDNNFYSWSQRQWWTRKLFRRWVKKPKELMSISKGLSKLKLIDPKIVDFLDFYTSDPEKFERAYQTWSAFRELRPSEEKVKEVLQKHQVNFNLIVGEYDKIITPKSAKQFASKVKQLDQLKLLPFGHDIFKPHIKEELFDIMMFEEL